MKRSTALLMTLAILAGTAAGRAGEADLGALVLECEPCHGIDGIARDAEVPHLAGQNELYLLNQLRAFHDGSRAHREMRYLARRMNEAEIEALAAYYAGLPR